MKFKIFKTVIVSVFMSFGAANAADVYTLTNGNFDFYDAAGVLSGQFPAGSSHSNVFADGTTVDPGTNTIVSQPINFTAGTGRLVTTTPFSGGYWVSDVADVQMYDGAAGGTDQLYTYVWQVKRYVDVLDSNITITCRISGSIDNCAAFEADPDWVFDRDLADASYQYYLNEGQFALHLFFDWSGNNDIPVLAVFNIDSIDTNGNLTTSAVDVGDLSADGSTITECIQAGRNCNISTNFGPAGDGVPGTKMKTDPFPDQTPVFTGVFASVTNDAPITGLKAPLTTDEDTNQNLNPGDFDSTGHFNYDATVFPSRVYTAGSKSLYIGAGTGYSATGATITPDLNYDQTLTIPVGITIDSNNSATSNISVSINALEDDPVISGVPPLNAPDDQVYTFTPDVSDPDTGDGVSCSYTSTTALPTGMSFGGTNNCTLSGQPTSAPGYVAQGIIITVTDDSGSALTASLAAFDITVTETNPPPALSGTQVTTIDEDASYLFTVSAVDVGDTITYSISGNPGWMSMTPNLASGPQASGTLATISGIPSNADVGTTGTITITATDSAGGVDSIPFTVTVNNTNDTPTIGAGTCGTTTLEARSVFTACTPTFADDDSVHGEVLTLSATGLPASLAINPSSGRISGTTTDADVGTHNIVITVADDETPIAATASVSFSLTVTPFISPPNVANLNISTTEGVDIDSAANPSDTYVSLVDLVTTDRGCDPGCLTFSIAPGGDAVNGALTITPAGDYTYIPDAGFNNDTDQFKYVVSDGVKTSAEGTVNIVVGVVQEDQYFASNFTMIDQGGTTFGGTNDVIASWDGAFNVGITDTDFSHMQISSTTPFSGKNWSAHHIRVFGPSGTPYNFDTTCSVAELESGITDCNNPLQTSPTQTEQYVSMTVGPGQIGAHVLFDWSTTSNIDVVLVWNVDEVFPGVGPGALLHQSIGYGPYPWSLPPALTTKYRMASQDVDGDGLPGGKMVDGPFLNYQANFNLDIITDASNMTVLSGAGATLGGANDVNANWNGITTNDPASIAFGNMRLSSSSDLTVGATTAPWTAHHIRVFKPAPGVASQTFVFDTSCSLGQLEAGTTDCGGTQISMTVASNQIGAHMLIDWGGQTNVDVVNVWNTGQKVDPNDAGEVAPARDFAAGLLFTGGNLNSYPWSAVPATDTEWNMVSIDTDDVDTVPGSAIVDGGAELDGNSINFNLFVAGGGAVVIVPLEYEVDDPDTGAGFGLALISFIWLVLMFGYRRKYLANYPY